MDLLGGVEGKVTRKGEIREEQRETEIELSEIKPTIGKLKEKKAIGEDGIPNEAWIYGGDEIERRIWKICGRI